MERKPDIQYIRYYTDGSAARKLELIPPKKKKPVQKKKKMPVKVLYIDPLPVAGILLSCVLLVCMIVGIVQLDAARQEQETLCEYVDMLQEANTRLDNKYREEMDKEEALQIALSMGMIPREEAQHITVQLPQQEEVEEPGFWQNVVHFLAGLFA